MEHVRWTSRPRLRTPVIIAAFAGWNDAGEAASNAGRHLADVWATRPFASMDAEEFYDFERDAATGPPQRRRAARDRVAVERVLRFVGARRGPRCRGAAGHRATAQVAHLLRRGARGRDTDQRPHAHHARSAARRGAPLAARLGDRHGGRPDVDRPVLAAAFAVRRADRHRRSAPRRVQHGRPVLPLTVGGGARICAGRAFAQSLARARRAGRRCARAHDPDDRPRDRLGRVPSAKSTRW